MDNRSAPAVKRYRLAALHALWWALFAACLIVSVSSHGLGIGLYGEDCANNACYYLQLSEEQLAQLAAAGIGPDLYGSLIIALLMLQNLSFWVVGLLLYRYGWKDLYCVTASVLLIVTGTIFSTNEALFRDYAVLLY